MKWATYNTSAFPHVFVHLGPTVDDEGFEDFLQQWRDLYKHGKDFYLLFETKDVGWVNPKYAFRMTKFIRELKNQQSILGKEYLQNSTIYYNSWYVKSLLKLIFIIQKPVAPVEILPTHEDITKVFENKLISK